MYICIYIYIYIYVYTQVPGGPALPGGGRLWAGLPWTSQVFVLYLVLLWLLSGLFVASIAEPFSDWLRGLTAEWGGSPGRGDGYLMVDEGRRGAEEEESGGG